MPNFILFLTDSWDGRYLSSRDVALPVSTPHADRLAARGTRFDEACCHTPLCCPSRASMWSGRPIHEIEAWNNSTGIPVDDSRLTGQATERVNIVPDYPTLMRDFRDAGYTTNLSGTLDFTTGGHSLGARLSTWLRSSGLPLPVLSGPRTGVQEDGGYRCNKSDWETVEAAADWLEGQESSFFLSVGVRCPHPYRTTSRYWLDQVDTAKISLPEIEEEPHPITAAKQRARRMDHPLADEDRIFLRQRYAAMIAEADAQLGLVMDAVAEAGLWDETYFVFGSDHGEMNLEHNLVFKSSFYEPSLRVPLIMAGPDVRQGACIDTPVSLLDLYPTFAAWAGLEPEQALAGQSLVSAARGEAEVPRSEVFAEYHANDVPTGGFMLRTERWKYCFYIGYPPELFDLQNDPCELNNLAEAKPDLVAKLDQKLRAHVDPEAVDAKAKADDRKNFAAWRDSVSTEEYIASLAELYGEWTTEQEGIIEGWLKEDPRLRVR